MAPGDTIAEATSGNTGISFAALGRAPAQVHRDDALRLSLRNVDLTGNKLRRGKDRSGLVTRGKRQADFVVALDQHQAVCAALALLVAQTDDMLEARVLQAGDIHLSGEYRFPL